MTFIYAFIIDRTQKLKNTYPLRIIMGSENLKFVWSKRINIIFLLFFLILFTFLGAGKVFDHQLTHLSPTGLMASDAFTHNWVAQNAYDAGFLNQPPAYGFENNAEFLEKKDNYKLFHPPILPILTASLAKFSGLNVYDVNIILLFCLIILLILMIYFILSKFNETLALFSLPLTLLFLQRKFFISLTWGWWDFLIGEFFLIAIILLLLSEKFKSRFFLSAILITVAFMSHGVEAAYAAIFIIFYGLYHFLFDRKEIKNLILEQIKTIIAILLLGGYSINIFMKSMVAMGYSQIGFMRNTEFIAQTYGGTPANYFIYFTDFIDFRALIVFGCLILVYLLIKKKSNLLPYYFFVLFMSISPYAYVMAGERGYQWRFLWPIYLSFAFGAVIYFIYYLIKNKIHQKYNQYLKISFFIIVLGIFLFLILPLPFNDPGLVDSLDYFSYQWIHQNTDSYAKFLIMFTPLDNQISRLYLLKRDMFISTQESWQSINLDKPQILNLKDHDPLDLCFCEKEDCSLFQESHFLEKTHARNKYYFKNLSVCEFDYIYLNFKNQQEIHAKNVEYLNFLISKNISQIVFNNKQIVIAKNILKGEQCETKFKS